MAALADQDKATGSETNHGSLRRRVVRAGELDITLVRDTALIETEWRRLERRDWNSPNQSLEWCRAWCQSHGRGLEAIVGRTGSRILFIIPLEVSEERSGRIAQPPGGRFNNINTGLFDEDLAAFDAAESRQLKAALIKALRGTADLLILDQVPLEWRGLSHPLAGLATLENQNHSFQLPLLGTMEATLSQLNAKTRRKKFRTQTRRMEAVGGFDHIFPVEAEEQHALLDVFFSQKSTRLQTVGLPDVFAPEAVRAFLHALIDAPSNDTETALTMHAIRLKGEHEGHIAAVTGLSRQGGHVLCQFSSIDDSIAADASPGELLFWLAIEHSIRNGATLFDFGIGDQPYKRSWCSQETIQHDILLPVSRLGALLAPYRSTITRIKTAVKKNPGLYAMVQRWRARRIDK